MPDSDDTTKILNYFWGYEQKQQDTATPELPRGTGQMPLGEVPARPAILDADPANCMHAWVDAPLFNVVEKRCERCGCKYDSVT